MLKKLVFIAAFFCILGCREDYLFEKSIGIPSGLWGYDNLLKFEFDIPDTNATYTLLLDVQHAGDYSFQNLYVNFHATTPSGEKNKQMVSLELAKKSGIWLGECSGNNCHLEIPILKKARFSEAGKQVMEIEQFMRKDPLPGVDGMTLRVKKNP